ncbi:hypothetical protein AMTR_s00148p00026310 [Amborella trichopoda]|uniref:Uncharacterized protein n=1 Tax=Amborella trichopoda TaxID=13333 RepID=W1PK11_AMBTC|nr:hypothetical protein AMTR_s00148p00026310 [Amborella trichopoda]
MDLRLNSFEFLSHLTIENSGEASTNQDTTLQSSISTIENSCINAIENSGLNHFSKLSEPVIDPILSSPLETQSKHPFYLANGDTPGLHSLFEYRQLYSGACKESLSWRSRHFYQIFVAHETSLLVSLEPVESCKIEVDLQQWGFLLDLWINYFKERGLPELVLGHFGGSFYGELYEVPFCVFDCGSLRLLKITNNRLEVPACFNGFPHIQTVKFKKL